MKWQLLIASAKLIFSAIVILIVFWSASLFVKMEIFQFKKEILNSKLKENNITENNDSNNTAENKNSQNTDKESSFIF